MDRTVEGIPTARFLWDKRGVVPFLKIDKGLEAEVDGCQTMKPMPTLDALLDKAVAAGIFGTKERSVVSAANAKGIQAVVDQQFAVAAQVLAKGLMPIIEPEVTISIADKVEAEALLRDLGQGRFQAFSAGTRPGSELNPFALDVLRLGDRFVVVAGLAHLGLDEGRLLEVRGDPDGRWQVMPWRELPGMPNRHHLTRTGELWLEFDEGTVLRVSPEGRLLPGCDR